MGADAAALLDCRRLAKSFGGVAAVAGLDLSVREGETVGIAGANGAGKTTLFNLIGGQHRPDAGTIAFDAKRIEGRPPHAMCRLGIARTFQATANATTQTVLGNVVVAAAYGAQRRLPPLRFGRSVLDGALEAISVVGLEGLEDRVAGHLSVYEQKRLMLAAALASKPRLLLLDEPVAGLVPHEIDETLALHRSLQKRKLTMIVIEHVMSFLVRVAPGRILVMHQGKRLFEGTGEEVGKNEKVREAWLGSGSPAGGGIKSEGPR
jgi:branched-chain amino acid transport system ATP-binding protein